jgi:signal transduction histidine kinase/DNA-binding response OmpR family regulator
MLKTLENRVAFRSALVALITVVIAISSLLSMGRFLEISGRVERSHKVVEVLKELELVIKAAESGQRGYLLTNADEAYLEPYNQALLVRDSVLAKLATVYADSTPERVDKVEKLKSLVTEKFAELTETVRLRKAGDPNGALAIVRTGLGERLMSEIQRLVADEAKSEQKQLARSAQEALFVQKIKVGLDITGLFFTGLILVAMSLVVSREMTERARIEQEFIRARDLAEAAGRAKGDFLANVSHEIRTPMNAILGMTELTLDTELGAEQRENLLVVRSATDSLLSIINDVLDFSKMDAGKLTLAREDFSLRDQIGEALGMLALRAADKGLELACRVDSAVPDRLVGDAARLRQVLVNLVGNALKFTEEGDVIVEVEAVVGLKGAVELHVRVTDTGIGIAPEKREMIFAPFTQADGSTTRLYGGTGLGLAISSQLVGLMGGRLWVDSELGRGSTFHFTANFTISEAALPALPSCLQSLKGLRVLVVDDNAVNRRILAETLAFWQMDPILADSGTQAITELEAARDAGRPISLVLLDALMPEMDGFTVASLIKNDPTLSAPVLMMLTSSDRHGLAERARLQGITACLNKPIHQHRLLDAILATVTSRAPARANNGPTKQTTKVPQRPLRILMAEDNPFNQRVVTLILAKSGHTVTVTANGAEAIALVEQRPFDLVLMDLQMPVMDGVEATAAIRAMECGTPRHIPIIAMTAHAMKEDELRCLASGMDGYIAKPIREDSLLKIIEEYTGRLGRDKLTEEAEGPSIPIRPALDVTAALMRVNGDREFLAEMSKMFVAESPKLMAAIREALDKRDAAALVAPAHSLKNWTGNFVATTMFDELARLEALGRAGMLSAAAGAYADLEREYVRLTVALGRFNVESHYPEPDAGMPMNGHKRRNFSCTR